MTKTSKKIGINEFTVEYLPRYFVKETLFAFANFGEYEEKILKSIDLEGDDIYSNLIRTVTFDENGFIASKMFLIDKEQSDIDGVYLESGKCLHTVLYTDDHDELIMNKLLDACKKWAKENDAEFRGVLYIFIKFVVPNAKSSTFYYDVWLPLRWKKFFERSIQSLDLGVTPNLIFTMYDGCRISRLSY